MSVHSTGGQTSAGRNVERCFVKTQLGQVHVELAGDADAQAVVLLHQTPRSTDEYADVIPLLAGSLRVIAIDTPGYGASDHPQTPPSMEDYAAVAADVLREVAEGPAYVCGHHTGAIIAVEFAAAYPELTRKVIASGLIYVDDEVRADLGPRFSSGRCRRTDRTCRRTGSVCRTGLHPIRL